MKSRYQLLDKLGQGGMAAVYRARDQVTGEVVALKRLLTRDADAGELSAKARTLFEREYHVLAQLAHPRVVRVDDYQVDDEGPFYTMELLDGGDLHALAPLDWKRACAAARDVCSALALVHSRRLVHRDVSPRNVRCTSDGQAKLIDFGAMAPMGPVKQVIGTPPICAPEVLNQQPLDARTDLYSLGATLYHALTGRHAYPAHDFRHLRELWQEPFAAPSALALGIPAALDALVTSMLSLEPEARPASAAEVLDRLSAIADLPVDEQLHVSNAYLHSPALIGRTSSLARARKKLTRVDDKRGSSTLVLSAPGVGRSRFLAACVLEGKLLGLTALRADAIDGQRGDYGAVRALAIQLIDNLPEPSLDAARPRAALLAHAIPELLERMPGTALETFAEPQQKRPRVQQALREWLVSLSKHRPLLIAIDDIHAIDEPSAALVALLATEVSKHAIALLVTARDEAHEASAMKVLIDRSTRLALANLDERETAQLLGSMFGEVAHLKLLAHKVFAVAQGNPRDTMALAQHLVDRRAIRYEAGSWTLPSRFDAGDLPSSIAQAHKARVAALSADGKRLAHALALAPDLRLTFDESQALLADADASRALRALNELLVAGVIASSARRYTLAQPDFVPFLQHDVGAEALRAVHLALAALFETRGDAFRFAQQLLCAGEADRGVEVLLDHVRASRAITDVDPDAYGRLIHGLTADWAQTYARAIEVCRERDRPRSEVHDLFTRMSELSPGGVGDSGAVREVLDQLKHDAGVDLYLALDSTLGPGARLAKSLELAHQRHQALPEKQRVLQPREALPALPKACIRAASFVASQLDYQLWQQMPSLKPYEPLSASFGVIELLNQGIGNRITARFEETRALYEEVIARLSPAAGTGGLDATHARHAVMGVTCGLGMIEAPMGLPVALDRARSLEGSSLYQVNVVLIRMLYCLWQGDVLAAEKHKHEIEMLRLQHGERSLFEGGHLMAEVAAHAFSDDLLRVKQSLGALERMAVYPAWRPVLHYARGEYHRIRADYANALNELEQGLELAKPGMHQMWCELASARVRVLDALGQHEQACAAGQHYMREAEGAKLTFGCNAIKLALACARAGTGDRAGAEELADSAIAALQALGSRGLNVGLAYEARARVALRAGDHEAFAAWAKRCGDIFRAANNRALIVKHDRLMRESRGPEAAVRGKGPAALLTGRMAATHIATALSACPSPRERARLGLDLLVARSGALGGFLYAIEPEGPVLAAQNGMDEPPIGLTAAVAEHLRADKMEVDTTGDDEATAIETAGGAQTTAIFTTFASVAGPGRELRPCVVGHVSTDRFAITGLAILIVDPQKPYAVPADVAWHLSRSWFDSGDVTSMTAWLSAMTAA